MSRRNLGRGHSSLQSLLAQNLVVDSVSNFAVTGALVWAISDTLVTTVTYAALHINYDGLTFHTYRHQHRWQRYGQHRPFFHCNNAGVLVDEMHWEPARR
jgi:hypothetical protein